MLPTKNEVIVLFKKHRIQLPEELIKLPKSNTLVNPTKVKNKMLKLAWLILIGGIGPVQATKINQLGITPNNIFMNLHHLPYMARLLLLWKPNKKIPHKQIPNIVKTFAAGQEFLVTGSWRRSKPFNGDIDILVLNEKNFRKHLQELHDWIPISDGNAKMSGIFNYKKYPVKIDLWFIKNKKNIPYMKLYSTGSAMHNIIMRHKAKHMGMKLTQYALTKNGRSLSAKSEYDIYKHLQMSYKSPDQR